MLTLLVITPLDLINATVKLDMLVLIVKVFNFCYCNFHVEHMPITVCNVYSDRGGGAQTK